MAMGVHQSIFKARGRDRMKVAEGKKKKKKKKQKTHGATAAP